ncbi:PAS domain S-box protein [Halovenus sp. WSH3]|uniref:PAS domain S-box protein n=1 Tax=Halovenus carboxidivorans TaxID=2692199 RepID=A0A6B0T8Q4_9EURY|nr:PAS domain-containing sensor histidine kinase [Halovenus carboxidivorans]MXR51240.1 PAS domain S-box protein [Halovenus carboxidivorans]
MKAGDFVGPVVVHDSGTIRYGNEEFAGLVGIENSAELAGHSLRSYLSDPHWRSLSEQIDRIEEGEPALGVRVGLEGTNGTHREVIAVSSPVEWEETPQVQTTFLDLTQGELAASLRENAMHEAPVGITIADATAEDTPLVYVNDQFVEMTGYRREEVLGRNCRFLQGANTRPEPVARLREAIADEESVTVELRNYRKDGSLFWNRVSISPVRDETGTVTQFLGFQQDISDAKVYEREKTLFESHAEASDQVMYVTDTEGRIEYVNPAFEVTTGYDADAVLGETPALFCTDSDGPILGSGSPPRGESYQDERTNTTKTGELYRVRRTVVPIIDDRGETTHYTVIERSVTEEQLTTQVLGVLDRVLRHNVRTAVNVIDGYAEYLESNVEGEKREAATASIRRRSRELREISEKVSVIRQLLETEEPSPLELTHLDSVVTRLRRQHPSAEIDLQVPTDTRRAIAKGNMFQCALEMAVEHAVEHNDSDPAVVEITVAACESDNTVEVEIADNGTEIPDSEWEIIEGGAETPLRHTSGIGLWVMYWAVVALGGAVERERNDRTGTTLTFQVPLAATSPD